MKETTINETLLKSTLFLTGIEITYLKIIQVFTLLNTFNPTQLWSLNTSDILRQNFKSFSVYCTMT